MRMSISRLVIFAAVVVAAFFVLKQCWEAYPPEEKWLYMYEDDAREYAGRVLGPQRGRTVPLPDSLAGNIVTIGEDYVVFSPRQNPDLVLAFAPRGRPPDDAGHGKGRWLVLRDGWYLFAPEFGERALKRERL